MAALMVGCKVSWKSIIRAQLQVQPSVLSKILYMSKSLYCNFLVPVLVPGTHYKGVCNMLAIRRCSFTYKSPFKVSSFPLAIPDEYSSQNCHVNPLPLALPHAGKFCSHISPCASPAPTRSTIFPSSYITIVTDKQA